MIKMELLNKIELLNKLKYKYNDNWPSEMGEGFWTAIDTIDEQPTVEAIPVEWLCNYALSTNNTAVFFSMFLEWYKEKENES